MLKCSVDGVQKDIKRIVMIGKQGWEIRDQQGTILWGADKTITSNTGSLSYKGYGLPLKDIVIEGVGQQNGSPTPDAPVMPEFCGKQVGADWIIPITNAGQKTNVYLGNVQTVRRVKKLVLTGEESWTYIAGGKHWTPVTMYQKSGLVCICSHYKAVENGSGSEFVANGQVGFYSTTSDRLMFCNTNYTTAANWKSYLATQYANGTPVIIWYVLATPETGIVNEPLAKIGNYADELHSASSGVTIKATEGQNTMTVDTSLPPSKIRLTGHIKAST